MAGKNLYPTEGSLGGILAGSPFDVRHYLFVEQAVPPFAATGRLVQVADTEQSIAADGVLSGAGSFVIGRNVIDNGGAGAILIGNSITQAGDVPTSQNQILIGSTFTLPPTTTNSDDLVAIGSRVTFTVTVGHTTFGNSVVIGNTAKLTCIGTSDAGSNVVVGFGAEARAGSNVVVGDQALTTDSNAVAVGVSAIADVQGVAVGSAASASARCIAIGTNARSGTQGVAIGFGATNAGNDSCVAIGVNAATILTAAPSIAIGREAACGRVNQFLTGSANYPIREICWGDGQAFFGQPGGLTYRLTTTTVNNIANAAGMAIQIVPGYGTGNWPNAENLGIDLRVGAVGAAGMTPQVETSAFAVRQSDLNLSMWGGLGAAFNGGVRCLFLANGVTAPTGAAVGGVILYVVAGQLFGIGAGGVATLLVP